MDFSRVVVSHDYVNLHGELIAKKGAQGVVRSYDRGMWGVDFPLDDERVMLNVCNRRYHPIPAILLDTVYDETNSVLFQK